MPVVKFSLCPKILKKYRKKQICTKVFVTRGDLMIEPNGCRTCLLRIKLYVSVETTTKVFRFFLLLYNIHLFVSINQTKMLSSTISLYWSNYFQICELILMLFDLILFVSYSSLEYYYTNFLVVGVYLLTLKLLRYYMKINIDICSYIIHIHIK